MKAPALTGDQIGFVLNDIAHTAYRIRHLSLMLGDCMESDSTVWQDVLTNTIMQLAERIGWAADMASGRVPGSVGPFIGDAVQWMMPPMFHRETGGPVSASGACVGVEGVHNG